jgi:hypothetical protein
VEGLQKSLLCCQAFAQLAQQGGAVSFPGGAVHASENPRVGRGQLFGKGFDMAGMGKVVEGTTQLFAGGQDVFRSDGWMFMATLRE